MPQPGRSLRVLAFLAFMLATTSLAWAEDSLLKSIETVAATSSDGVDADFPYQGEYSVHADGDEITSSNIGLQVIAWGKGQFSGAVYQGGLPGNGWDGSPKTVLSGTRVGKNLILKGADCSVELPGDGRGKLAYSCSSSCCNPASNSTTTFALKKIQRRSLTMGAVAPAGATVLFDGTGPGGFDNARLTSDGLLMVGCKTKQPLRNFTLHLEFRNPYMPLARGQGRGNSGVYLQGRYEVQILDSFGLAGAKNECGGLYKQRAPDLNMCFPPLAWQTYDMQFAAAQFDCYGEKICNARLTVLHNGVVIHNDVELPTKTGAGAAESSKALPTLLQDHGNPVHFRNIWICDHDKAEVFATR